jgi:hypothetical protein
MLTVCERADRVSLSLRWSGDTGWQRFAEPMLHYISDLVVAEARPGSRRPEFVG